MKIPGMLLLSFFCSDLIAMEHSDHTQPEYYQNVEDYFNGLPGSSRNTISKTAEISIIITHYDQRKKPKKKTKAL